MLHGNKHGQPVRFIICQLASSLSTAGLQITGAVVLVNPQQWFKTQTVRVIIEVVERRTVAIRRGGIGALRQPCQHEALPLTFSRRN